MDWELPGRRLSSGPVNEMIYSAPGPFASKHPAECILSFFSQNSQAGFIANLGLLENKKFYKYQYVSL